MSIKKYDNQSNPFSTNIFETCVGVMNIAPTKISGQYKIVVGLDNILYLDDYTGRRVILDKNDNFLKQVSNFLKLETTIDNNKLLSYGAFQQSTRKSYHIPLYLGSFQSNVNLPKYYVLSRVQNETINISEDLYKYSDILQVIDLDKIGLIKIFNEILSDKHFDYPIYFNFAESNISIFGYSIKKQIQSKVSFDITNLLANQPYLEVLNNKILNEFDKQKIFFPKFLNIEFEFEYSNNHINFNNFYGYFSTAENITLTLNELTNTSHNIKIKDYKDNIVWEQQNITSEIILNNYLDIIGSGSIQEINEQIPQIRFLTTRLSIDDKIIIRDSNQEINFQYIIKNEDIVDISLYQSLIKVCHSATKESKNSYIFTVKELSNKSCIVTIKINFYDTLLESFAVELPFYFKIIDRYIGNDNYFEFRGIDLNDIWLCGQPNLFDSTNNISINDKEYLIIDKFKYEDKTILRLNENPGIDRLAECKIFNTEQEKILKLTPIPFLNFHSKLKSYKQYNQESYSQELLAKFNNPNIIDLFNIYISVNNLPYITDTNNIDDIDNIEIPDYNTELCLNMLFNSIGQTSYLTPNILSIDKRFYEQNGNLDNEKLDKDLLRYNWFLIKSECPDYLKNNITELRFFTEIPKITSSIIKTTDDYCETIFLGVKYQLPIKYTNYSFAVYLTCNNKDDITIGYTFDVNDNNKTIYLVINKYLDFIDLIRNINGDELLLDLSFFYSINDSFNSISEYVGDFKTSSLKLCTPFEINENIVFEGKTLNDWKTESNGIQYIALRLNLTSDDKINDLREIFKIGIDNKFYVYSSAIYNGIKYDYKSLEITVIGLVYIEKDYLWCTDILIDFFNTDTIFLQKINNIGIIEIIEVNKAELSFQDIPNNINNIFGNYLKSTLINGIEYQLILPDKQLSVKKSYFEIVQKVVENTIGEKTMTKDIFLFNDTEYTQTKEQLIELFDGTNDDTIYDSKITLFDRNQIWYVLQQIFITELKFKGSSNQLVRNYINKFMITNLYDYSKNNFIKINNTDNVDKFIDLKVIDIDKNVCIWNLSDKNMLVLFNRFKTAYSPYMELSENEKDFQLTKYKKHNTLFNIYDINFGGTGISATGLWNEVQGNLVSSLFCKEDDIILKIDYISQVDYKKIFIKNINIDDIIITNNNYSYIEKIDKNINEYIFDKYVDYLLNNFYYLDSITNEYNQKIEYLIDSKNNYLINFKPVSTYVQNFTKLNIIFKRK